MYRNQKIILLHSEEEDKLPESLKLGELAVNCHKDKEFICLKNTDNQLIKITPNGGGAGNSSEKQPFKLVAEKDNAIISEGNESNESHTLTHGMNMRNDSEFSFAFGNNKIQLSPISINGKYLKLIRDISQPVCTGYYDGAIIVDENGNHVSDLVSYSYENDNYILDIEVSNEFNFKDGPKFMILKSNEKGSCNFNFGLRNHLNGTNLCAIGNENYASGVNNYVFGNSNVCNSISNVLFGLKNKTDNGFNLIHGEKNYSYGSCNIITGSNNNIGGNNGIFAGQHLEGSGKITSAFGICNDVSNSYLITVGNGYQKNDELFERHNAFSISELGEIMIQEDIAKKENEEIKYPPMISLQSLVARIKTLEEELNKLKNK